MNDPWDVKSVRQSGQYVSCMKINGAPLLPPVLSRECRKEMQYYKLLAKEVEKRISLLQPYVLESDTESSEDKTDAPEIPDYEHSYELPPEDVQVGFNVHIDKVTTLSTERTHDNTITDSPKLYPLNNIYNSFTSNATVIEANDTICGINSPKYIIDLSLNINKPGKNILETIQKSPTLVSPPIDLPERDYNFENKIIHKELLTEFETVKKDKVLNDPVNFTFIKGNLSDPFPDLPLTSNGPSSLSSKSFTGSLNDIHKESQIVSKLTRQRSYTLLNPSPQLLAHLEVQSLNTGVEVSCISMSESLSNLSTPSKKRRSWDLESAKVKWSSMALELKQKKITNAVITNNGTKHRMVKQPLKKVPQSLPPKTASQISPPRAKSVVTERSRRGSITKPLPKSEPIQKIKRPVSPVKTNITQKTVVKEHEISKLSTLNREPASANQSPKLVSDSADPATRVRDLYEKIQTQQLIQMASLVEKQKREQLLLQQVFEEQNNLLYKQLETICPKSPVEIKEDWRDNQDVDRGPVSLSQLISNKSPDQTSYNDSVSSTLTDTNNYISLCDNVLKKSRDLSGSIRKPQTKSRSQNGNKIPSPRGQGEGSRTRTNSPNHRNISASRKLQYDTSASSEREYETILTDRTNDTMADLNVTFPSDNTDEYQYINGAMNHLCGKEVAVTDTSPSPNSGVYCRSTDSAIRSMEKTIQNSINSMCMRTAKPNMLKSSPTAKEREAATKIVAHAKGYLVRRLMRTDRVQGTVQTIKDALLCALQLHQDREGIRGADVDLHRRLIQQITAACYSLHDTFIASSPAERCAMVAVDRTRRRSLAARQPSKSFRPTDIMSQSYSGAIPSRAKRASGASLMTQSNYETFSADKGPMKSRYMPSPRRRPWR